MNNIVIMNNDKLILEKKLIKLRAKIFKVNINLLFISFCSFIFMPIIMVMISLNPNIAVQFNNVLEEKSRFVENLLEEYNNTIKKYNAL